MRSWFPETGPRGGRYRVERMRCKKCGTWFDGRFYEMRDPKTKSLRPLGATAGLCPPCMAEYVRPLKRRRRESAPSYKSCRGCGVKHAVEHANLYCPACIATWHCYECGDDRPEKRSKSWTRCMACDWRAYRYRQPMAPRAFARFTNLFGALLSAHVDRVVADETRAEREAIAARDAVARLRRYPGRGRPSKLTFPVVLTRRTA